MSVTPHTRFVKASDIFLKRVASFERSIKCAYDECKNYLTTSETAQADVFDVVEEKYGTSYIAYIRCLSNIDKHLKRLKSSGTEIPSPAIVPPVLLPPLTSSSHKSSPPSALLMVPEVGTPSNLSLDESVLSVPVQSDSPIVLALPETSSSTTCRSDSFENDRLKSPPCIVPPISPPLNKELLNVSENTTSSGLLPSVFAPPETFPIPTGYSDPVANSTSPVDTHRIPLPPIDIDVFAGDFISWRTFRDLFTTIFVHNSQLSNIERLYYLVQKTTGEAREIVSRFPLTDSSFPLAWKALSDAYDNKRIVVNNYIKTLFDIPPSPRETVSGLKTIQRGINSCLAAMTVYEVITDHWDPIVVYICLQRLPKLTLTLWEQSIKNKSSLPSWKDLDAFLAERIQTLMCVQSIYGNQSTKLVSPKNVISSKSSNKLLSVHKSYDVSPPRSTNLLTNNCPICPNQRHVLRLCPEFTKLSFEDKFLIVKKHNCCINCLSRGHAVKNCSSKHSCNSCKQRHHSLLHRPPIRKVVASSYSKTSLAFTDVKSRELNSTLSHPNSSPAFTKVKSRVFSSSLSHQGPTPAFTKVKSRESSDKSKLNSVPIPTIGNKALLGTARVNIVHNGKSYTTRAIIDPSSQCSIVTMKLKKKIGLPTHPARSDSLCSNKTKSRTPREACSLKLSSPKNTSKLLETNALVLPNVKGKLFSPPPMSNLESRVPTLELADTFDDSPIDLLIGADLYPKILEAEPPKIVLDSLLAQKSIFGYLLTGSVPPACST
ncbi:uncharacterized protein [Musca autumnalis]|uniref:uncharacterized protein n=1 Tax=Musca autumnalis TaxID=221902 RepID=UPI003CFA1FC7